MTRFLDLFSGIGGFALGAYRAGLRFDAHYFSEVDPYAISVYQRRFPDAIPLGDIRSVSIDTIVNTIRKGRLIPKPCEICGAFGTFTDGRREVQAHHDDYNKPLEVRWLCQKHHHEWHKTHKAKEVGKPTLVDIICGGFP